MQLRLQSASHSMPRQAYHAAPLHTNSPLSSRSSVQRIELFEQYQARAKAAVEEARAAAVPITVTLPDGSQKQGIKGATTPMDVAKEISSSLAKKVVVADVDGKPWDLTRPLTGDCALKLYSFDDPEGKDVGRVLWLHLRSRGIAEHE